MKKKLFYSVAALIGILLLGAGLFLLKWIPEPQGIMLVLPYVCIGLGCGLFGHGFGELASQKAARKNPQLQKQIEIEKKDERNLTLSNGAKAKAFDRMLYTFGAVMIAFSLMGVSVTAILLLVVSYLFIVGSFIYYLNKYHKEM